MMMYLSGKLNKKALLLLVLAILPLSVLWSAGQQETARPYPGKEGKITVYLSGPSAMLDKLENSFEKDNGDVLEFVHMGCGPLRQRIWTEMEAGMINADVFWGSDPLLYKALDERGLLEAYVPVGHDSLKAQYQTEDSYICVNERYGVVIYNKDTAAAAPSCFEDLLAAEYKDNICHADPALSSTALALVSGLWDLTGEDGSFHQALGDNGLFLTKKNSDVPSKIQEGEFAAGIAPHDAVLRLQKKAKKDGYPTPLAICWPEEGAVAIQRPVAISLNENRPELNEEIARAFVDFLISKKAQKITSQFGFVSVRSDLPLPAGLPGDLKIIQPDWKQLSESQDLINEDFKKYFQ